MRRVLPLLFASAVLAFAAVGPVAADQGSSGNCKGATVQLLGPNSLWPPNHKMVTETLQLSGALPGERLDSMASSNEAPDALGSGHTLTDYSPPADHQSADSTGTATSVYQLRAERAGPGNGRTYTINYMVDNGLRCSGSFSVSVPHDMGGGNDG